MTIFANGFKILLLMFLLILFKLNRIQNSPVEDDFVHLIYIANGFKILLLMFLLILFKLNRIQNSPVEDDFVH